LVSIDVNGNIIELMIIIVVASIFSFVSYYIVSDVSSDNFRLLKIIFLGLMIVILSSFRLIIFIG